MRRRVALLMCLGMAMGCPNVGSLVRKFGYTEIQPPSTLLAPGTIVWIRSQEPFSVGVVCSQRSSLGTGFEPQKAPTAAHEITQHLQANFPLEWQNRADILDDPSFRLISDVSVELRNASLYTVSDADVVANVMHRDPACTQAIEARRKAGFTVTMIASALRADVTYHVNYRANLGLSSEQKADMLEKLAPRLGLHEGKVSDSTLSGEGLYWGVVDDAYLAGLQAVDFLARTHLLPRPMPMRRIPAEVTPIVDLTLD